MNRTKYGINIQHKNNYGMTALKLINKRIREEERKNRAPFQELKDILEEAISTDNEPKSTRYSLRLKNN